MKKNVALVIVYNHKFDRNIDIIERIYGSRFANIYHLVPFYAGNKRNVIPVYESSYYFQGYIAQGYPHFKGAYRHYFFIADDMILNPSINEDNYAAIFGLDEKSGFLPELDSMPAGKWPHNRVAITYDPFKPGVEIRNDIPPPSEAASALKALNVVNGPYSIHDTYFWNGDFSVKNVFRQALKYAYDRFVLKTDLRAPKYSFARSYSDIFILSATNADRFIRYCGAFAATDLWVELAIPTALVLSGEKIRVQAQMKLQGRPLWSAKDYELLQSFDYQLKNLLERFPENYIYLHPIKLSKWDVAF